MNAILGHVQVLQKSGIRSAEDGESLNTIIRSGDHLLELIAIETDDTSPDRDAADGMLLLRLTVDEDGLLWDIELRQPQGRVFWISVDEFSKDPFSPPTPVS